LEIVGTYNPLFDPAQVTLKEERIKYWIDNGAKPTDTVKSLLKEKGVC
jgi:small subunit ribosomal protein S16